MTEEDLPARVVGRGVRADAVETQHLDVPGCARLDIAHGEAQVVNVLDHPHPSLRRTSAVIRWRQVVRCDQSASVPELNFDERIATRYETYWPELFEPAVVDPAVDFLAELGGAGARSSSASAPVASRCRSAPGCARARDRAVAGDGGAAGDEAGRGRHRRDDRRLRDATVDGTFTLAYLVRNTIMNLTDAGRTGRVLPQRRRASGAGRLLRHRGHRAGSPTAPAR